MQLLITTTTNCYAREVIKVGACVMFLVGLFALVFFLLVFPKLCHTNQNVIFISYVFYFSNK